LEDHQWRGYGDRVLFACEYECPNFRGGKFSTSRVAAVDVPYFLSKYDPDPLRFYLTATAPETRDTEFSWENFVERNNELVATWGNLDAKEQALLEKVEGGFETVGDFCNACEF
jgi:methionyl-tRNA synthetase